MNEYIITNKYNISWLKDIYELRNNSLKLICFWLIIKIASMEKCLSVGRKIRFNVLDCPGEPVLVTTRL